MTSRLTTVRKRTRLARVDPFGRRLSPSRRTARFRDRDDHGLFASIDDDARWVDMAIEDIDGSSPDWGVPHRGLTFDGVRVGRLGLD